VAHEREESRAFDSPTDQGPAAPASPIDAGALLTALRPLLAELQADLVERAQLPGVRDSLEKTHAREKAAQRTAEAFDLWCQGRATQVAAAWVLSVVFVRTLEDRELIERRRIAGPGAEDSQRQFLELAPFLSPRDYLLAVFRELSRLPGAEGLFDARHNPVWVLGPSGQVAAKVVEFFRQKDDAGALRWQFGGTDTRFLGDLYQDLDEGVRKRYALLQTPDFVESFILDETLTPAIKTFGLEEVKLIDPTCGSGHFLLGAFGRLFAAWQEAEPAADRQVLAQRALAQVYGADLNPYAVAIARFRLTLAFLEAAGLSQVSKAPPLPLNVCVADSLLHGKKDESLLFSDMPHAGGREAWGDELFALEDESEGQRVLGGRYHAVVGNPPYITEKDRARREKYRSLYPRSAAGKYALAAPFTERFFELGVAGGYVGLINANSFMKREFGKKLIEQCLPSFELTQVVDSSGAYIPGHGTPTVLLFGRNQRAGDSKVLAVLGKRGEPSTPDDPSEGEVWSSIRDHHREVGFENDYLSVAALDRERFGKHPWSLGGGGASELKELLEERSHTRLKDLVTSIGFMAITGEDEVFARPTQAWQRFAADDAWIAPFGAGEGIRDWTIDASLAVHFPYKDQALQDPEHYPNTHRLLWPYRTLLANRPDFGGKRYLDVGRPWFSLHQVPLERLGVPYSIAYAEVATHNHFVLDRGGKVFNRTAPIIKLPEDATEEDHLALLGYLNSSTACFWMKQVCHKKSSASQKHHVDPARAAFQFGGTALGALPIPTLNTDRMVRFASALEEQAALRSRWRSGDDLKSSLASGLRNKAQLADRIESGWTSYDLLTQRCAYLQEELDWQVYAALGWAPVQLLCDELEELAPLGSRPFEISTGYDAGVSERVRRSGSRKDSMTMPPHWARRMSLLAESPEIKLIERREFKRQWRDTEQNVDQGEYRKAAVRRWLEEYAASRLETVAKEDSSCQSLRSLLQALRKSEQTPLEPIADYLGEDERQLAARVVSTRAAAFCTALRHTQTGITKRRQWEATWELQRREDAGESVEIAVPPKYKNTDFAEPDYYRNRGKLDVPKESFISYPGAESDNDPSPLYGWAGWDHLQQATALSALYQQRKDEDGWPKERVTPLLAGLAELVPWLKQWHNEPDAQYGGLRLGDFYETFVNEECRKLDLTTQDLEDWRPPRATRSRSKQSGTSTRKPRKPALTPEALLDAIKGLQTDDQGVAQKDLAADLGVSSATVGKTAKPLVEAGILIEVSKRPKRYVAADGQQ
jgi:hypothetical protein